MNAKAPSLTISGLSKRFGATLAVDALDLRIESGEIFGLLGPNGAGKTTLVRMICGFVRPDAGTIRFDDKSEIGVCPQELVIWDNLTCIEQLVFVAEMYGIRAKTAHEFGMHLLESLDLVDRARRRASTLSGGMKRRLNLLLALAHDPNVVLLDEPEAGLDPQSRILVREFVKGLSRRKTIILTSHNMDEVDRVADRVGIMNAGKLLIADSPRAIKMANGAGDSLRIEIENRDASLVARGVAALERIAPNGVPVSVEVQPRALIVRSQHAVDAIADAVNALRRLGIPVLSLTLRENTLEDAFISLTGRSLTSENAEAVS